MDIIKREGEVKGWNRHGQEWMAQPYLSTKVHGASNDKEGMIISMMGL